MVNETTQPHIKSTNEKNEDVQEKAKKVAEQAKQKAGETVAEAKETLVEMKNEAINQASSTLEDVKSQAVIAAEEQKDRTTDRLHNVVGALRQSSQQFRGQEDQTFANYTDSAADQVEQFANYLDSRDIGELLSNVQDLARKQPELFIGGALAAGFFLGRFFKSSQSNGNRRNVYYNPSQESRYYHPERTYERRYQSGATAYNTERSVTNPNIEGNKTDWGVDYNASRDKGGV